MIVAEHTEGLDIKKLELELFDAGLEEIEKLLEKIEHEDDIEQVFINIE